MEVKLSVTMRIKGVDNESKQHLESLDESEIRDSVYEAVNGALVNEQEDGFLHPLENITSLRVQDVSLVESHTVLKQPLTIQEIRELAAKDEHGLISGVIACDLSDAINRDLEEWLDFISEELTGDCRLMGSSYKVVGTDGDALHVLVSGDPSMILDTVDEDE